MTESVVDIIKRISPDFPVETLLRECGGRRWWIPPVNDRPDYQAIREAIQSDPCRDWRVIMRRYGVSRGFVYAVWNRAA